MVQCITEGYCTRSICRVWSDNWHFITPLLKYNSKFPEYMNDVFAGSLCIAVGSRRLMSPGCTVAEGLLYKTVVFSRSYLHRQVSPPETLVVKGGTTWARNGR